MGSPRLLRPFVPRWNGYVPDAESAVISITDHTKIVGRRGFLGDLGGFARNEFDFAVTVLPITEGSVHLSPTGDSARISRQDASTSLSKLQLSARNHYISSL